MRSLCDWGSRHEAYVARNGSSTASTTRRAGDAATGLIRQLRGNVLAARIFAPFPSIRGLARFVRLHSRRRCQIPSAQRSASAPIVG
jgi:hypothetical protein